MQTRSTAFSSPPGWWVDYHGRLSICNWRSLSKANIVMCPMLAIEGRFTMKRITEEGLSRKPGTSDLRCVTPDSPSTPYILTNFKPKCLKFKSVVKSARLKPHIKSKIYCRALFEPHIEEFSKKWKGWLRKVSAVNLTLRIWGVSHQTCCLLHTY